RWFGLAGACIIGLAYTTYVTRRYPPTGRGVLSDIWFGRAQDPQLRGGLIDAKVWLYLIGAVMLQLIVLSSAAYHLQNADTVNPGFLIGCAMLTWFCFDYLIFEKVHLWTYDFIAERVGFKLGFGCLAFYPYFYAVPLLFTASLPNPGYAAWLATLAVVVFLAGWVLTRGANLQKYFFKTAPSRKFLWIQPKALSDDQHQLLVSGYWGLSRHINYLGETLQAVATVLAVGYPGVWVQWLYPAYYVALFLTRQADDDRICAAKYGQLWDKYTAQVKYKIIPFVY
ncbi:MAG: ERG4/ERG24 family protein, partial [Micrococcales bacterium]|nr:ERG4/ERG24 family protein [Micrococcales bacterium]